MANDDRLFTLKGKVIAIDGPAGSGKSTTAKKLAERLGYIYLDTGAMYRAVTLFAIENNIDIEDGRALEAVASRIKIRFKVIDGLNRIYIQDRDVSDEIRTPEVTAKVSPVSAHAGVRKAMVECQRKIAGDGNVVADGRDTTSVVFPQADLKIYLDASLEERARRRLIDFTRQGIESSLDEQIELLEKRDRFDSGREHSPLTKTKDSVVIDTTRLNIEEQVDRIIKLAKSRLIAK
jgi:CMP/dCMP kinase